MSKDSQNRELEIALSITASGSPYGITAERPKVGTKFSDVLVHIPEREDAWVEVKMNHADNMMNTRICYEGGIWHSPGAEGPAVERLITLLTTSDQTNKVLEDLRILTGRADIDLTTTKGAYQKNPKAVPCHIVESYTEKCRYILKLKDVEVGELIKLHYQGKKESVDYLQAGDDFYILNHDPYNLAGLGVPKISPTLKGTIAMRVGIRKLSKPPEYRYYEIQPELKFSSKALPNSAFSCLPSTEKKNPFRELGELMLMG